MACLEEYTGSPVYACNGLEVKDGKHDPPAYTSTDPVVRYGTMIIIGFGSKVAPQLRPKVVDMVSQSGSSDNAGGTGPERVLSETSIAERASDQVAGDRLRACNYVNTQLRPSLKTLSQTPTPL